MKGCFHGSLNSSQRNFFPFLGHFVNPKLEENSPEPVHEQQCDYLSHCEQLAHSKFIIFVCLLAVTVQLELQREVL